MGGLYMNNEWQMLVETKVSTARSAWMSARASAPKKRPFEVGDVIENEDVGIHYATIVAETKNGMKVRFLNGHIMHYNNNTLQANFKLRNKNIGTNK